MVFLIAQFLNEFILENHENWDYSWLIPSIVS